MNNSIINLQNLNILLILVVLILIFIKKRENFSIITYQDNSNSDQPTENKIVPINENDFKNDLVQYIKNTAVLLPSNIMVKTSAQGINPHLYIKFVQHEGFSFYKPNGPGRQINYDEGTSEGDIIQLACNDAVAMIRSGWENFVIENQSSILSITYKVDLSKGASKGQPSDSGGKYNAPYIYVKIY